MALDEWYLRMPVVTRIYLTLAVLTTATCAFDFTHPVRLLFSYPFIRNDHQFWRLLTSFLYFGNFEISYLFHIHFVYVYFKRLEDEVFNRRTADFLFLVLFGAFAMLLVAPFLNLTFLSHPLSFMVMYVWSKKVPNARLNFFDLFVFPAALLPWVLLGFAFLLGASPVVDVLGIAIGHLYFYLETVLPLISGVHVLETPRLLKWICGQQ